MMLRQNSQTRDTNFGTTLGKYADKYFLLERPNTQPFVLLIDKNKKVIMASKNYFNLTQIEPHRIIKQSITELCNFLNLDYNDRDEINLTLENIFTEEAREVELNPLRKLFPLPSDKELRIYYSKILEKESLYCSICAVNLNDILERTARLNRITTALNNLIDLIMHDIYNKVSVVGASLELFLETKDSSFLNRFYRAKTEIENQIETLKRVKSNILLNDSIHVVSLSEIFNRLKRLYADRKKVKIILEENIAVIADELLTYVLENLINNALQHSKAKNICIKATKSGKDRCNITVKDDGIGIPEEYEAIIFTEKLPPTTTTKQGKGLLIIRSIIDSYGGRIEYRRNKPKGATFIISLKRAVDIKRKR